MEENTQDKWAIYTQYPNGVVSHGDFIFTQDKALTILNHIKEEGCKYTIWIQKEHSDEKL
jgi:hypothetical protein